MFSNDMSYIYIYIHSFFVGGDGEQVLLKWNL